MSVCHELGALQGTDEVLGASGPIQFTADYRTNAMASNPVGKPVPILRLGPDGSSQFVTPKWPTTTGG